MVGWNDSSTIYMLLLNLVNLRDLFGVVTKLKKTIFKKNNQISSTITVKTLVLSTEWTRTWPSVGIRMKNGGGCLNGRCCYLGCEGYFIVLTKVKAMSLCLFWLFVNS